MKKILLVAYNFPPLISPQSLRWFYLGRELCRKGYEVDVLTIKMPGSFTDLLDELPQGITVHRTFPGPFYHLTFKYSREASGRDDPGPFALPPVLWKAVSFIYNGAHRILNSLLIPDIYSEWFPFAVRRGLRLLRVKSYDVIISSSEPRMCHLVGCYLNGKSGVPWIADYGDPWIYPVPTSEESDMKKRLMEKIERRILKKTAAVTVAAEGIKKLYMERYPFIEEGKMHVMTQGFAPDMFSKVKGDAPRKFRIVYCGSFYRRLRDPSAFFEAVKEADISDLEVVIVGRINEFADMIKKEGLDQKIKYCGFLDHKGSLALQKNAAVLLHVGNLTDTQVPGKIYEYFGAARPVLCIRGGDEDLSAELIMRYNKGIVVKNKKEEIAGGISRLHSLWRGGMLDKSFNLEPVDLFAWKRCAGVIEGVIEKL